MKKNSERKRSAPFHTRTETALCVAFGVLQLLLYIFLSDIVPFDSALLGILLVLVYLCEVAVIGWYREKNAGVSDSAEVHDLLAEEGSVVFKNSVSPIVVLSPYGKILWYNRAMKSILSEGTSLIDHDVSELIDRDVTTENFRDQSVELFGKHYTLEGFRVSEGTDGLFVLMMRDMTDFVEADRKYREERVCVAYVAIDNVEDILQYVHDKFQDAVSSVEEKLRRFANSMDAVLKSYDNEKYLLLFDSHYLDECIANRFSILDEIRDTRVGDGISITVSMGVSRIPGSLADRERAASQAIDLALQRGGDQVVYKSENSVEYYGGRTKSVYKRSNVRSRSFTSSLMSAIARADNVLIMGHRFGDFDCFGAAVGVARLSMICGVKTNIAVDLRDKNLAPCIRMIEEEDSYSQVFVDNAEGLDLLGPDTLLILVDHNTLARSQFPDIAEKVHSVVVIDHHRKITDFDEKVVLSYIEPSASSTCELVTEMLECSISSQSLLKAEADILLAGILLDTKRFTRNTGTRTFGAAGYLRGAGANPTDVYNLFKTDASDLTKEARFHTSITVYRECIALSCYDGDTDDSYRVIASKAADEMLTLRGIEAAFTLVRIGDHIHISGRSTGKINVQLILEKLHGGGHFDVAGAQVVSNSTVAVLELLKNSIDDYLDSRD